MNFRLEVHYQSGRIEKPAYKSEREREAAVKAFAKVPTVIMVEKTGRR